MPVMSSPSGGKNGAACAAGKPTITAAINVQDCLITILKK
jgi:hypothetical protein